MADNAQLDSIIDMLEIDSERLHKVVNGSATDQITVEDGSLIPSVRKALVDNLYFKTPPLEWVVGSRATVFNQLYTYTATDGSVTWWYAPAATASKPVVLPANPNTVSAWKLYFDYNYLNGLYAPITSPSFKGIPQAPTPAITVNSDQLATTSYVNNLLMSNTLNSNFKNIVVSANTKTQTLEVTGTSTFLQPINAQDTTGTFKNIIIHGETGNLIFDYRDPTNPDRMFSEIKPFEIISETITSENLNASKATVEEGIFTNNISTPIANIGDLNVTGTVTGITFESNVDGQTILPESVTTNSLLVNGRVEVTDKITTKDLEVTETANIKDLNISGNVTGLSINVDGIDINPLSVTTTEGMTSNGDLTVAGSSILSNIIVSGVISPSTEVIEGQTPPEYIDINGGLRISKDFDTLSPAIIKEQGERVYSPNNKPTPSDIGTYTSSEIDQKITESGGFVDAPNDGKLYGRQNEAWAEVTGGGGSGTVTSVDNVTPTSGNVILNAARTTETNTFTNINTFNNSTFFNGVVTSDLVITANGGFNTTSTYKLGDVAFAMDSGGTDFLIGKTDKVGYFVSTSNPFIKIGTNNYKIFHEGNRQQIVDEDLPDLINKPIVFTNGIIIDGTQAPSQVTSQLSINTTLNTCVISLLDADELSGREFATATISVTGKNFTFDTDGSLTVPKNVSAIDFIVRSDIRDKSNITIITNALSTIKSWKGTTYDIKGKTSAGLIAQDLQKTSPELITKYINEEGEERLNVSPYGVEAYLVEAIKELSSKYDLLEAKYQELLTK